MLIDEESEDSIRKGEEVFGYDEKGFITQEKGELTGYDGKDGRGGRGGSDWN